MRERVGVRMRGRERVSEGGGGAAEGEGRTWYARKESAHVLSESESSLYRSAVVAATTPTTASLAIIALATPCLSTCRARAGLSIGARIGGVGSG